MRKLTEIVLHCSATPEGKHFTVEDIDRWHKGRGWSGIGYHYVNYLDGLTHKGRPVEKQGAHVAKHNRNSIGICYIGGVAVDGKTPLDTRTPSQKIGLAKIIRHLVLKYPTITTIKGHRDYPGVAKACPSFDASEYAYLLHEEPREDLGHAWPQPKPVAPEPKKSATPTVVGTGTAGGVAVAIWAFWDNITAFFGGLFG